MSTVNWWLEPTAKATRLKVNREEIKSSCHPVSTNLKGIKLSQVQVDNLDSLANPRPTNKVLSVHALPNRLIPLTLRCHSSLSRPKSLMALAQAIQRHLTWMFTNQLLSSTIVTKVTEKKARPTIAKALHRHKVRSSSHLCGLQKPWLERNNPALFSKWPKAIKWSMLLRKKTVK
jgi:hypothetical protein